jgi:ABC-type sugar transport system ATPase subunit
VGARLDIYTTIAQLAESGSSVIVISSDMQEVIGLADRVIVMCEGAITGELVGDEVTEGKIMELAIPKSSINSLLEDKNGTH